MSADPKLPTGTVTFVFTDIEGSTRLLRRIGSDAYGHALLAHRQQVRNVVAKHDGVEMGTEGDAFFLAFARADDAVAAADGIRALCDSGPIRVRVGVHTGQPIVLDRDYVGLDVHRAARICSAAHGGQVLVSETTRGLATASFRDLGLHRLKDLAEPERLYQLGPGEFPPLRAQAPSNLPAAASAFIGRRDEVDRIAEAVRRHRVVTLTGPGGVGKTRLALEVASALTSDFADGVWWIRLAAVMKPDLVVPTIGEVTGARGDIADHLAGQSALLVLDNFEQLVDAASPVLDLMERAPRVHVLVTSRERLAVPAEREWPVTPLAPEEAMEMFVELARGARPDVEGDETIRQICDRLDCLPLALELASTRLKMMTPEQMLDRLASRLDSLAPRRRGVAERHATMRATLDWSYELLTPSEQAAFRTVAIFRGGFDADAAVGCGLDPVELEALLDKSLVQVDTDGRFSILQTTREYGLERLRDSGDMHAVALRHAEWFSDLARRAGPSRRSSEQRVWFQRLRAETDNFRAALEFARSDNPSLGVGITSVLWAHWRMRGLLGEILAWYDAAFADRKAFDEATLMAGLRTYGLALFFAEEYTRAEELFEELLERGRDAGDRVAVATAHQWIASVQWSRGSTAVAIASLEEALSIARTDGDRAGESRTLHLLGENQRDAGDFASARASLEAAVAIDLDLGDQWSAATSIHSLGDLALDIGDPSGAAARYLAALATGLELGDDRTQAYCVAGLASVAALGGHPALAAQLWGSVAAAEEHIGFRMLGAERARYERVLSRVAADPIFTTAVAGGRRMTLGQAGELFAIEMPGGRRPSPAPP